MPEEIGANTSFQEVASALGEEGWASYKPDTGGINYTVVDGPSGFYSFKNSGRGESTGFKAHISVDPSRLDDALRIVVQEASRNGICEFKIADLKNTQAFANTSNEQCGKFFAIFDHGEKGFGSFLKAVEGRFKEANISPGPAGRNLQGPSELRLSPYIYARNDKAPNGKYQQAEHQNRFNPHGHPEPDWIKNRAQGENHSSAPNIGSHSEQGHRPYQEDRLLVQPVPSMNEAQAAALLEKSTRSIAKDTSTHMNSGSTFTGAVVTENGNIVTAHLGDSPAAAIIYDPKTGKADVVRLTEDHTPSQEQKIITHKNGERTLEMDGRVWGKEHALAVNRALGDGDYGQGVSKTPEVQAHDMSKYHAEGKKVFLLVASDGALKEKRGITLERHAEELVKHLKKDPHAPLDKVAQKIVSNSLGSQDNVTAALVEVTPGKGAVVGVFDGHGGAQTSQTAVESFGKIVGNVQKNGVAHATPKSPVKPPLARPSETETFHYEKLGSGEHAQERAAALQAELQRQGIENVSVVRTKEGGYHNSPIEYSVMVEGNSANVAKAKTVVANHLSHQSKSHPKAATSTPFETVEVAPGTGKIQIGDGLELTKAQAVAIEKILKANGCTAQLGKFPDGVYCVEITHVDKLTGQQASNIKAGLEENGVRVRRADYGDHFGFDIRGKKEVSAPAMPDKSLRKTPPNRDAHGDAFDYGAGAEAESQQRIAETRAREATAAEKPAAPAVEAAPAPNAPPQHEAQTAPAASAPASDVPPHHESQATPAAPAHAPDAPSHHEAPAAPKAPVKPKPSASARAANAGSAAEGILTTVEAASNGNVVAAVGGGLQTAVGLSTVKGAGVIGAAIGGTTAFVDTYQRTGDLGQAAAAAGDNLGTTAKFMAGAALAPVLVEGGVVYAGGSVATGAAAAAGTAAVITAATTVGAVVGGTVAVVRMSETGRDGKAFDEKMNQQDEAKISKTGAQDNEGNISTVGYTHLNKYSMELYLRTFEELKTKNPNLDQKQLVAQAEKISLNPERLQEYVETRTQQTQTTVEQEEANRGFWDKCKRGWCNFASDTNLAITKAEVEKRELAAAKTELEDYTKRYKEQTQGGNPTSSLSPEQLADVKAAGAQAVNAGVQNTTQNNKVTPQVQAVANVNVPMPQGRSAGSQMA
ncbi:MAG: hypothetical protein CJBNEKGG_03482 [Prosthecobacter sp.]|nr:hypothetical protein [Prosthecobacter sp.]